MSFTINERRSQVIRTFRRKLRSAPSKHIENIKKSLKKSEVWAKRSQIHKDKIVSKETGSRISLKALERGGFSFSTPSLPKGEGGEKKPSLYPYCLVLPPSENKKKSEIHSRYSSLREFGKTFNVTHTTISSYLKSGKLFRNIGFVRFIP